MLTPLGRVGRFRSSCIYVVVIALALLGAVRLAHSQDDSSTAVRLDFENRSGAICPDAATLAKDVAGRLGYDPFSATANDILVVTITRTNRGLRGEVRWGAGARRGEMRALESRADCREVARALALTMSIAIDPLKAMEPEPLPAPPDAGATPAPTPSAAAPGGNTPVSSDGGTEAMAKTEVPLAVPSSEKVETAPAARDEPSHNPPTFRLALDIHGTVGLLPAASAGAAIGVELAFDNWMIWAAARSDLPAKAERNTGFVVASAAFGTGGICRRLGRASVCAFGRGGRLQGGGEGYTRNGAGTSLLVTVGGRATYDVFEQHPMRLRLFLDCDVPLTLNKLLVDSTTEWAIPAVAGTLGAAMVMSIP